mmetsp:Transcript_27635/g.60979  ORF Transcript_27635/g.60979 Transcript_27635/m.60979 type:complete len:666 (+) Transcript_27635:133-2130(+)
MKSTNDGFLFLLTCFFNSKTSHFGEHPLYGLFHGFQAATSLRDDWIHLGGGMGFVVAGNNRSSPNVVPSLGLGDPFHEVLLETHQLVQHGLDAGYVVHRAVVFGVGEFFHQEFSLVLPFFVPGGILRDLPRTIGPFHGEGGIITTIIVERANLVERFVAIVLLFPGGILVVFVLVASGRVAFGERRVQKRQQAPQGIKLNAIVVGLDPVVPGTLRQPALSDAGNLLQESGIGIPGFSQRSSREPAVFHGAGPEDFPPGIERVPCCLAPVRVFLVVPCQGIGRMLRDPSGNDVVDRATVFVGDFHDQRKGHGDALRDQLRSRGDHRIGRRGQIDGKLNDATQPPKDPFPGRAFLVGKPPRVVRANVGTVRHVPAPHRPKGADHQALVAGVRVGANHRGVDFSAGRVGVRSQDGRFDYPGGTKVGVFHQQHVGGFGVVGDRRVPLHQRVFDNGPVGDFRVGEESCFFDRGSDLDFGARVEEDVLYRRGVADQGSAQENIESEGRYHHGVCRGSSFRFRFRIRFVAVMKEPADVDHRGFRGQREGTTSPAFGADRDVDGSEIVVVRGGFRRGDARAIQEHRPRSDVGFRYERIPIDPAASEVDDRIYDTAVGVKPRWKPIRPVDACIAFVFLVVFVVVVFVAFFVFLALGGQVQNNKAIEVRARNQRL